jgi:hypothetical protein
MKGAGKAEFEESRGLGFKRKRASDLLEVKVLGSGQIRFHLRRYLLFLFSRCDHPIAASKQHP